MNNAGGREIHQAALSWSSPAQSLTVLGIAPTAQQVYRWLLKNGSQRLPLNSCISGIDNDDLIVCLAHLERHGMVHLCDGEVRTVRPSVAVADLVERRLSELDAEVGRVIGAWIALQDLEEDWRSGRPEWPNSRDVERFEDERHAAERLLHLALEAQAEVLCVQPADAQPPFSIKLTVEHARICLRRGVHLRLLVHASVLERSVPLTYFTEIAELGGEIRISRERLNPMIIYDSTCSVVPLDIGELQQDAGLFRQVGVTVQLRALFEWIWRQATELPPDHIDIDHISPSATDKLVLQILSRVDKDEVAARELGISVRTFRRNVADLLKRLGASSRFQAALLAAERGWL